MNSTMEVAKQASVEIEAFLRRKPETIAVINVEDDKHFQRKDIDLLWIYKYRGKEYMKRVEIKADRYARTGNYFIETISNQQKNTKGCFLYTEADLLFYYFVDTKELNSIPMPLAREWFLVNENRFVEKELSTKVGNKGFYTSKGRLVPKKIMNKEVKGVKVVFIEESEQKAG
jgi:hypothetical protein